jgi:hypothetical protein
VRITHTAGGLTRSAGAQFVAVILLVALVIGVTFQLRWLPRMQLPPR